MIKKENLEKVINALSNPNNYTRMNPDPKFFCIFAYRCKVKSYKECKKCFKAWLKLARSLLAMH